MMGIVVPETFWAHKKYNKTIWGIYLVLILQVNKKSHKTFLRRLREALRRHRPEQGRPGSGALHRDNAPAHRNVTAN